MNNIILVCLYSIVLVQSQVPQKGTTNSPQCTHYCNLYENDGVCNVPQPCSVGSDCADCEISIPIWSIISLVLSILLLLIIGYTLYSRKQEEHDLLIEESTLQKKKTVSPKKFASIQYIFRELKESLFA